MTGTRILETQCKKLTKTQENNGMKYTGKKIEFSAKDALLMTTMGIVAMASVNVTSAYVGDVADVLLSLTKTGNQAVEKGSINVEPGVQKALFIPRFNAADDQLQDRQEDPTLPSDSFTYNERSITPLDIMFYDKFNPRNFENVWRTFQPSGPLVDKIDNPQIQAALIAETMKSVGKQLGKLIWQGDVAAGGASPLRFFDGYLKIAAADGAIAPTPAGVITAANVISILEATEAAIPSEIWEDPSVVFHMNTTDYRLYQQAARALDFKGTNIAEAQSQMFAGRQIRTYTGMSKNFIMVAKATAGKDSNLWAAVDVAGDDMNVKIEKWRPEGETFFAKVLFKYAVQIGNPTEVVLYSPA